MRQGFSNSMPFDCRNLCTGIYLVQRTDCWGGWVAQPWLFLDFRNLIKSAGVLLLVAEKSLNRVRQGGYQLLVFWSLNVDILVMQQKTHILASAFAAKHLQSARSQLLKVVEFSPCILEQASRKDDFITQSNLQLLILLYDENSKVAAEKNWNQLGCGCQNFKKHLQLAVQSGGGN